MFVITAQLVKPVNRDDLPQMKGMDGLKGASPLGIEPKGEGIQGPSGFSTGGDKSSAAPSTTPSNGANTNGATKTDGSTTSGATSSNATTTTATAAATAQTPAKQATDVVQQASAKPQQ